MGGYGSTRWRLHGKRDTVEDCRQLSIFDMAREGLVRPDTCGWGRWIWFDSYTHEERASIGYEVNTLATLSWMRLYYTMTKNAEEGGHYDYKVLLTITRPHFGGVRWWFICPLKVNGRPCRRRVAKLYLPPGAGYFGCRHCYKLTYRSSQESDKRVSALRRLDLYALLAALNDGEVDWSLGLKALPDDLLWRR